MASYQGHCEVVRMLLEANAGINILTNVSQIMLCVNEFHHVDILCNIYIIMYILIKTVFKYCKSININAYYS